MRPNLAFCLALLGGCATTAPGPGELPAHPSELRFENREIVYPVAADYRHRLDGGNVAYVVPDHSLPLIKLRLLVPAGGYLLEPDQAGLTGITSAMLRDGGTAAMSPMALDERLDFLASAISFAIGTTQSTASLDTLSVHFDESLRLMFDMLTEPGLDPDRLRINLDRAIELLRKRNDDTRTIEPRVWSELLLGDGFFVNHSPTGASVEAITAEAIRAFAARVFASGRLIFAVSGDIEPAAAVAALNRQLQRLPRGGELPPVPQEIAPHPPGLYGVAKPDVNQTRVTLGHPGPRLHHPDEYAIAVMNEILGGGGFTSRITSRVRSEEGLAYSAGSAFSLGRHYPGQFRVYFQSKNESVARALAIVLEEIERIRGEPAGEAEDATAIESQVAFLADLYSSASRMAERFAADELNGEDPDYWRNYEARIRAVTATDVQRAAAVHLKPDQLRVLVVGGLDQALAGGGPDGGVEAVVGQPLTRIPLRDPLTLEPLE